MFTRKLTAALCAAFVLFAATNANAGLFGKLCKKNDCCEPAPVCCEPAPAPVACCAPVAAPAPAPCCAPAPPANVNQTLCLVDQCTGCSKTVNVCIPACCANEAPCITCRKGAFGRKIYTAKWACCGHCETIVWTKHGRVRVR